MPLHKRNSPTQLEDVPNIGKSIAADLRRIGIQNPGQLAECEPLATFRKLAEVMGHRHDPCVLYTLMAAKHFFESGEALPWWTFTEQGKKLLASKFGSGTDVK
ncbi:MAG TPA: helix-hairpin-helix domain-containing protein [Geomobilimonas sp.]|nr:helix-hairpin-helix domain-containing protein [Geomobilimonas sp.]